MNNSQNIFESKHDMKMNVIMGSLIIVAVSLVWGFIVFNYDLIYQTLATFIYPFLAVVVFLSMVGGVIMFFSFDEANHNYIKYKTAEIRSQSGGI